MSVFEFGSGHSTIWWNNHVQSVVSCEHDKSWFQLMKQKSLAGVDILYCDSILNGEYSKTALKYGKKFDIIVIDGRDRVRCAQNSLEALKSNGVIVWDNSDRIRYEAGYKYLADNNFKRLDFTGIGPMNSYGWCTSIFYRVSNCLGI